MQKLPTKSYYHGKSFKNTKKEIYIFVDKLTDIDGRLDDNFIGEGGG